MPWTMLLAVDELKRILAKFAIDDVLEAILRHIFEASLPTFVLAVARYVNT